MSVADSLRSCTVVRVTILCLLLLPAGLCLAAIDSYQFDDPVSAERFQALIQELRCPKCQNQNIADSNAPLSNDLRRKTYEMVRAGSSDDEIRAFMVERYGDFVTYRPPLRPLTWPLWFGPLAGVLLAAGLVALWVRRRNRDQSEGLAADEQRRLQQVLDRFDEDGGS